MKPVVPDDLDSAVGDVLRHVSEATLRRIARADFRVADLDAVEPRHVDRLELFDALVDQARIRIAERDRARALAANRTPAGER